MRDTGGLARECSSPENKDRSIFMIKKKKVGLGEDHLHLHFWWVDIKADIISFSFGLTEAIMVLFKSYVY